MLAGHPLLAVALAVALLLVMILRLRWQAFVALLLSSLIFAALVGMPVDTIPATVVNGMGKSLGLVATLVGLGAIFGAMLERSGGALALARWMIGITGLKGAPWALTAAGFLISIPVFLDVALVILCPLLMALGRSQGKPAYWFGLPLLAGLAVSHAFIPPTPGPVAVAELFGVSLGPVILMGAACGLPGAILAGPVFSRWIVPKLKLPVPEAGEDEDPAIDKGLAWITLLLILAPIALILAGSLADVQWGKENRAGIHAALAFVGHPVIALLLTTLAAMAVLAFRTGAGKAELQELATAALGPAGIIILVTGAGGVFKEVLVESGAGKAMATDLLHRFSLGPVFLAWFLAMVIRVSQGSATVAMVAAAGLVSPIIGDAGFNPMQLGLLVAAIAAGASTASHVNDSGFWMVSRLLQLTERQTLQSWTVVETIISLVGLAMALLLWPLMA
jgi:Gnt-I system low-affinity gluconate transporter